MSKQSSVEYLKIQFEKYLNWKCNPIFDENCFDEIELMKSLEQAKAMHKQEIVEHHTWLLSGVMSEESARKDGEDYYNQTFEQ